MFVTLVTDKRGHNRLLKTVRVTKIKKPCLYLEDDPWLVILGDGTNFSQIGTNQKLPQILRTSQKQTLFLFWSFCKQIDFTFLMGLNPHRQLRENIFLTNSPMCKMLYTSNMFIVLFTRLRFFVRWYFWIFSPKIPNRKFNTSDIKHNLGQLFLLQENTIPKFGSVKIW